MMIQSFLIDIGHIPDGYWTDEKEEEYGKKFRALALKMADAEIVEFKEWEKDGRPENDQSRIRITNM